MRTLVGLLVIILGAGHTFVTMGGMKYMLAPLVFVFMLPTYMEWLYCKIIGREFVWLDENSPPSF